MGYDARKIIQVLKAKEAKEMYAAGLIPKHVLDNVLNSTKYSLEGREHMIRDVIFHEPATIVFWADGTKTVVKCQPEDTFDPEKGLAMAIAKRFLGDKGNYYNEIRKWTEKYEEAKPLYTDRVIDFMKYFHQTYTENFKR